MPSSIQSFPKGLLAALGIKSLGQNPNVLSDVVQPEYALEPYYMAGRHELITVKSLLQSTAGSSVSAVVPAGEYWRIVAIGGRINTPSAAGALMYCAVGVAKEINTPTVALAYSAARTSVGITDIIPCGVLISYPLILSPGDRCVCFLCQPTGGAFTVTVEVNVHFVRLS